MRKTTKPFPTFESEAEERRFWESRDSAIAWTGAGPSACGCPASDPRRPLSRFDCP